MGNTRCGRELMYYIYSSLMNALFFLSLCLVCGVWTMPRALLSYLVSETNSDVLFHWYFKVQAFVVGRRGEIVSFHLPSQA